MREEREREQKFVIISFWLLIISMTVFSCPHKVWSKVVFYKNSQVLFMKTSSLLKGGKIPFLYTAYLNKCGKWISWINNKCQTSINPILKWLWSFPKWQVTRVVIYFLWVNSVQPPSKNDDLECWFSRHALIT